MAGGLKISEMEPVLEAKSADIIPIIQDQKNKRISVQDLLKTTMKKEAGTSFSNLGMKVNEQGLIVPSEEVQISSDYHSHNLFRGKNLGEIFSAKDIEHLTSGNFENLHVGDYWLNKGVHWRIAGINWLNRCGDTDFNKPHLIIVPDENLYNGQMHTTLSGWYEEGAANTTKGGYVESDMFKTGLTEANRRAEEVFPGHVAEHKVYLCNAVDGSGKPTNGAWFAVKGCLMSERMVYGNPIFAWANNTGWLSNYQVEKSQLPLFAQAHDMISNRRWFWLRDTVSSARFAGVDSGGIADDGSASRSDGVRPYFVIA